MREPPALTAARAVQWAIAVAVAVATGLLLAACSAGTPAPSTGRTVVVRVEGNPTRTTTASCVFELRARVVGGGTQITCLHNVTGFPGPSSVTHSEGTMTFDLPEGTVRTNVRIAQRFATDGVHARQVTTGVIVGGTGGFAAASGRITGSGIVADRADGIGPVAIVYRITFPVRS